MKTEFCNISKIGKRYWLVREEYVGGPRLGLIPSEELKKEMPPEEVGRKVVLALDAFFNANRKLKPSDWEKYEYEASVFYDVKSAKELRAKIRNFTIRRTGLGYCFFNGKTGIQFMTFNYVDEFALGQKVLEALEEAL